MVTRYVNPYAAAARAFIEFPEQPDKFKDLDWLFPSACVLWVLGIFLLIDNAAAEEAKYVDWYADTAFQIHHSFGKPHEFEKSGRLSPPRPKTELPEQSDKQPRWLSPSPPSGFSAVVPSIDNAAEEEEGWE